MTPRLLTPLIWILASTYVLAQTETFTLSDCVAYALERQPELRQARLAEERAELANKINLAAWLPTVSLDASLTNNIIQQVSIFPSFENPEETQEVTIGTEWTSLAGVSFRQLLYSPEVARDARQP